MTVEHVGHTYIILSRWLLYMLEHTHTWQSQVSRAHMVVVTVEHVGYTYMVFLNWFLLYMWDTHIHGSCELVDDVHARNTHGGWGSCDYWTFKMYIPGDPKLDIIVHVGNTWWLSDRMTTEYVGCTYRPVINWPLLLHMYDTWC